MLANAIRKNELGREIRPKKTRFFVDQNLKTRVKISLLGPQIVMRKPEPDPYRSGMHSTAALRPTATPEKEPGVFKIGRPKPRRPEGVVRPQRPQPGPSRQGALAAFTTYV